MKEIDATIVVVPRDHFSDTKESLESVLELTPPSCPLVYVDGNSPAGTARYLRKRAEARHFLLLRYDHYLTPNQARNTGARHARTRHIVFVDNDVVVAPDWLESLVECADAAGAAVVGPLNFERRPLHEHVHFAGGDARIAVTEEGGARHNHLIDRIRKAPVPSSRETTDVAEFHCMLVRSDVLRRLGGLDENMLSTRENVDFCLALRAAGEIVCIEPRSRITYLPPAPLRLSDVPFFALRWSDQWDLSSFHHLRDKWQLDEDEYFLRQYRNLGWRRRELMMRDGLLRWLVSCRVRGAAERLLRPLERRVNAAVSSRHAWRLASSCSPPETDSTQCGGGAAPCTAPARLCVDAENRPARSLRGYLFVAPWDVSDSGGVNQVILNLSRLIGDEGTYVPKILVTSSRRGAPPASGGVSMSRMRLRPPIVSGAPIASVIKWIAMLVPDLIRLCRYLRTNDIATVNVHYPSLAALQLVLARALLRRPPDLILSFHGLDLGDALRTGGLERRLWKALLRNADAVVACSDALKDRIAHLDPGLRGQITTIHNGIDIDHTMRTRNPGARIDARLRGQTFILSVASYESKKGLDVLMRAFAALCAERVGDAMLALVGPDLGIGDELRRLAAELGIARRVVFCGAVPHADLHAYYEAATVFCLASRAEPFGIVLLEAGVFRCPVVATSVGGIPEVLTHDVNACLGPPDDPAALAAHLRRLLCSASECDRLAGALFEHVRANFPWTRALRSYMKLARPIDSMPLEQRATV